MILCRVMKRRTLIDRSPATSSNDSRDFHGTSPVVRFSEQNTFYSVPSVDDDSDEIAGDRDSGFYRENTVTGTDPWHVSNPALRRLSGLTRLGAHIQLPGGHRTRQPFTFPNGFRSLTAHLARLSSNEMKSHAVNPVFENTSPVLVGSSQRCANNEHHKAEHKQTDDAKMKDIANSEHVISQALNVGHSGER